MYIKAETFCWDCHPTYTVVIFDSIVKEKSENITEKKRSHREKEAKKGKVTINQNLMKHVL